MSLFACNSIKAAQDLQHKGPGGMEAVGQSFFYNAGTQSKWPHIFKKKKEKTDASAEKSKGNLPKYFTDIGGVSCRGCGRYHAHFPHVRGNTFSQQRLKQTHALDIWRHCKNIWISSEASWVKLISRFISCNYTIKAAFQWLSQVYYKF